MLSLASIVRRVAVYLAAIAVAGVSSGGAIAGDNGYVLFLSEYLHGDFYFARLGDVDGRYTLTIRPLELELPESFRQGVELGNHDVSFDGNRIVFAARSVTDGDWDIYTGTIDLQVRRILDVQVIIGSIGSRDEDPRFSWDGAQIAYKCDGNICIYPDGLYANPVVQSWCELWAPSFDASGYTISYTKRCAGSADDRIWHYSLLTGSESGIPSDSGSTDRFAHYLDDGRLVFSRTDIEAGRSSLWVHDSGAVFPMHDRTVSDDDPYPDKHDANHVAFIGWDGGGYDLYVYRQSTGDSVRLSNGLPILAPVLFRVEQAAAPLPWIQNRRPGWRPTGSAGMLPITWPLVFR